MNTNPIRIASMQKGDEANWAELRTALWPDCPAQETFDLARAYWAGHSSVKLVLFAFVGDALAGFAEIGERNVIDSLEGAQAYLEGWYIAPAYRGQKIGGKLIAAAEDWARAQGYDYLASDVEPDNFLSQKAHLALGFKETGRSINYAKKLK